MKYVPKSFESTWKSYSKINDFKNEKIVRFAPSSFQIY